MAEEPISAMFFINRYRFVGLLRYSPTVIL